MANPSAVIYGCEGLTLTADEKVFFSDQQPLGFILFQRNCDEPEQVKALVQALKACVVHADVPILIDQEGGRVARLKPPHWPAFPPAQQFADLAGLDLERAQHACYLNARLMAYELVQLGINTDCAPVADLRIADAHDVIGDRAFGEEPRQVVALAAAQADGLMDQGVMPVLKHIPGHGRALVDSHLDLPLVKEDLPTLLQQDCMPFQMLADLPMAMTAHIKYEAIDPDQVATLSPKAIAFIRKRLGFDGLLMSDDVSMKALRGEIGDNAAKAIDAGCDIALHCNGNMAEMRSIAAKVPTLTDVGKERVDRAFATIADAELDADIEAMREDYKKLCFVSFAA